MPTVIERPNYDGFHAKSFPLTVTANAGQTLGPVAGVNGALKVTSALTVTNASDRDFVDTEQYAGCWQFFDIPGNSRLLVKISAFFNPLGTTHSRTIVDEPGFSTLDLDWKVQLVCYVAVPALGWQRFRLVDSLTDRNAASHTVPNTVGRPRSAQTARWVLPRQRYANGLMVYIGLYQTHSVVSDDVTVTSTATTKGTLSQIAVSY